MTEVINNTQPDIPTKRPVGRPRKSNIPVPATAPVTLEEYRAAKNAYARDYYRIRKTQIPKNTCAFTSKVGRKCTKQTYRDYCHKHISLAPNNIDTVPVEDQH